MGVAFGPGPLTPAVKWLLIANVVMFLLTLVAPTLVVPLALRPVAVLEQGWVWQLATYMFLHGSLFHVLFNMLSLWMFGVELERLWGTVFFAKYYAVAGVGAAVCTVLVSLLPVGLSARMYYVPTVGASGAIFGLLLAYALYYPHREIYMYFLFRVPVRIFVTIVGAIALLSAVTDTQGGVAHVAHLGGLVAGWFYLKSGTGGPDFHPVAEIKYRYLKWKMNRGRRKFDVYSGGRSDDVNRRIH
jgi:membrane associated rhomboid family serine protease